MSRFKTVGDIVDEINSTKQNVVELEKIITQMSKNNDANEYVLAESRVILNRYTEVLRKIPIKEEQR